jgi:FkbM family methyltransferase
MPNRVQAVYLGADRVVVALPNGRHLFVIASDLSLTPEIVTKGMYDWPFWHFLHRYVRNGDRVVDVGANIGLFTVAMAQIVGAAGHVTAYEADPEVAAVLDDNVTSNWFGDRVTLVAKAAADRAGALTLRRHGRYRGSSAAGVVDLSRHAVGTGYQEATVDCERLDDRLTDSGRLRLVKVDVEGGEASVVAGMTGLLDRAAVEMLDLEVLLDNADSSQALLDVIRDLVDRRGARPHLIDDDGSLRPTDLATVIGGDRHPHVVFAFD